MSRGGMARVIGVEVCILGAGPVGTALAARLARGSVPTAIVDRAPLPPMELAKFDGRAYAIALTSQRLLDQAGIWARVGTDAQPILGIRISDGVVGRPASRARLHFDHAALGAAPFGWLLEARHLRTALNRAMAESTALHVFAPASPRVSPHASSPTVALADGTTITARLLVVAEGRASPTRTAAGIGTTGFAYGQHALVAAIAHERPHRGIALEHFLPGGPFAQLPLPGDRSAIVMTEAPAVVARLAALPDASLSRELGRRLGGDHLGQVQAVGLRWTYPLSALLADRYVAPRLALVGDAAHGIHPIAGQGLNLGFRDVAALADLVLDAVRAGRDPGEPALLAAYQRARRPANLAMLLATDGLDRLFSNDNRFLTLARRAGIAATDRLGPAKGFFMRAATGLLEPKAA